jgi:hypothetical protein
MGLVVAANILQVAVASQLGLTQALGFRNTVMRLSCIMGILLAFAPACARPATVDVPILLSVHADLGDIYVGRMHLEVGILGVYAMGRMHPNIEIALTETLPCIDPLEACGASRSIARTYDKIDKLIVALTEAQEQLRRGKPYKAEIGLVPARCVSNDTFRGTVAVDLNSRTIRFAPESSNAISLNADQAAGFLALLNQASAILAHLKPKFDAFNAAPVDESVQPPLERPVYRQPLENPYLMNPCAPSPSEYCPYGSSPEA